MPKTQEILTGLHAISNKYSLFAIFWHVIFYIFIMGFITHWEPSNKLMASMLCLPLVSVAIFAWITGNPFNGIMFSVIATLIFIFGMMTSLQPINTSQIPFVLTGTVMIFFGIVYPHFLETTSFLKYIYASPVGLIPCPTLSILIGFVLLFDGFGSPSISLTFIIAGLFYGVFGVLKLAVYLDLVLIFGALALLAQMAI